MFGMQKLTFKTGKLCWFLLLCFPLPTQPLKWYELPSARRQIFLLDEVLQFKGDSPSSNRFKVMIQQGDNLLIGGRNGMRRINLMDFTEIEFLEWTATKDAVELCELKGKSSEECQNFIKVLVKAENYDIILCGTNAFKPKCRRYREYNDKNDYMEEEWDGRGLCPHDPNQPSTALYSDKFLYTGTMADFNGNDPVIHRHPNPLRTGQFDLKQLNNASFVSSVEYGEYVYLFFRETAMEHTNCGKVRYSRVGRVCKKDQGGARIFDKRWTTFLKARLNCSHADEFPFYFNEIQSTSEVVESSDGVDVVYAVLSTPMSAIPGSAICSFSMNDIIKSFDGPYKGQENSNANWLPVPKDDVPKPRPGECFKDSKDFTHHFRSFFIHEHPLMDKAVPSRQHQPLAAIASTRYRFTQLVVDAAVPTPDGSRYDVLFVGTDNGNVLKMIQVKSWIVVLEDLRVLPYGVSVNSMMIASLPDGTKQLIVLSDELVVSTPVSRCARKDVQSCKACVALQDPYCVWNVKNYRCQEHNGVFTNSAVVAGNKNIGLSDLNYQLKELCK